MNFFKKVVLRVIDMAGFHLVRKRRAGQSGETEVRVGSFVLQMKKSSLLPEIYAKNPGYSGELGRAAGLYSTKYPDCAMLDIGANYGDSVAVVKSVVDMPVICYEGDPVAYDLLIKNLVQFRAVTAFNCYLGEKDESLSATVEKGGWNSTLVPGHGETSRAIQLRSIDSLAESGGVEYLKCKIIKIDTEGFDFRIMRGSMKYIEKTKPLIVVEYNRDNMGRINENGIDTLWQLRDLGYDRIVFFDGQARFVISLSLADKSMVQDLHDYADGRQGAIYHYDLCIFHRSDADLAKSFEDSERLRRVRSQT